jgi:predicted peptidase
MENPYPYDIYYPESYQQDEYKKWPLLLFLHGAGERGSDLTKLKAQGLPAFLQHKQDFPFVVAYPQCPARSYWSVAGLDAWLDEVLQKVNYDEERLYLTGLSMGGYGTWHWAAAHPEKFAAIIPICGGGDPAQARKLTNLPTWAFHGAKDNIVPLEETQQMVNAVKRAGGNVKVTIYPNLFHDSWTPTYNNPEIYDWLLQHKKTH